MPYENNRTTTSKALTIENSSSPETAAGADCASPDNPPEALGGATETPGGGGRVRTGPLTIAA